MIKFVRGGQWSVSFLRLLGSRLSSIFAIPIPNSSHSFFEGDICDVRLLRLQEKQVLCRRYRSSGAMTVRVESDVMLAHANLLFPAVIGTVKLPLAPSIVSTNHKKRRRDDTRC